MSDRETTEPDIIERIVAHDENRAPREPEPAPPPEPATPLDHVRDQAGEASSALVARFKGLSQEQRLRDLRGLLHEIQRWYHRVEVKVRVGRRKSTTYEVVLGNPESNYRQNPKLARWIVDAALAIVEVAGVEIARVHDPRPPHGDWGAIFADLNALLRAENLTPMGEHVRAERARIRAQHAETKKFRNECDGIMRAFLNGELTDAESSPAPAKISEAP